MGARNNGECKGNKFLQVIKVQERTRTFRVTHEDRGSSLLYMFPLSILFSIYPIKPITSKHLLCKCKFFIRDKIHNVWATKFNLKKLKTSRYSKEMQLFTQTIKSINLNLLLQYCLQSYFITKSYLLYMYFYHLLRLCSKKNRPFHDFSIFDKELHSNIH